MSPPWIRKTATRRDSHPDSSQCLYHLLHDRALVIIARNVVTPPLGEWNRRASSTENRKGQDEQARQAGTIEGTSNEVRVILEDAWAVIAEVELRVETSDGPAEEDTGLRLVIRDVSGILDELGEVDLVERELANTGNELI